MQLVENTQRYWKYKTLSNINLKFRGISIDHESAWFPQNHQDHIDRDHLTFTNQFECENYMELIKMSKTYGGGRKNQLRNVRLKSNQS